MRVEVLTDATGLTAARDAWQMLWERAQDPPPFLAPAWLLPWWQCFGDGNDLYSALAWEGGALRGILPLYRYQDKLLPLGVGITDYFDVLTDTSSQPLIAANLLRAVLDVAPVARCDLPELPPGAWLRRVTVPAGWSRAAWDGPPCPVLDLQPAPAIPAGMRRDVRQARNRAARAGGFHIRRGDATTLATDLAGLIALHTSRWAASGEAGVLADETIRRFHRLAAPELLRGGLLRLETLYLGGAPAASVLAFLSPCAIHFYISGYDRARHFESPGTILLAHMLEEAAREGRRTAHFLRGGEAYKYAWGARDEFNVGIGLRRT